MFSGGRQLETRVGGNVSFIETINSQLCGKPINDWNIGDLFWTFSAEKDAYTVIIDRYHIRPTTTKFKLEDNEAEYILSIYDSKLHVLTRCVLSYFISQSNFHSESKLADDCTELIQDYFDNVGLSGGSVPIHDLITVIRWTAFKFPDLKAHIRELLLEGILFAEGPNQKGLLERFSLACYLIKESDICSLLTQEDFKQIYEKYYVSRTDDIHVLLYFDYYRYYLEYFKNKDKKEYRYFLKKYCDYALNCIPLLKDHLAIEIYQSVRKYMDELKEYSDADYAKVDSFLEKSGKDLLEGMQEITIKLPDNTINQLNEFTKTQKSVFDSLENDKKLEKLINEIEPVSVSRICEQIENRKAGLIEGCNDSVIDEDGKVIFYSRLNEKEAFSLRANEFIRIWVGLQCQLLLYPFFNSFKLDESAKNCIQSVLNNNPLVPTHKIEEMVELIEDFFSQDFKHSVYNICEEFEDCLRQYFKSEGMNIYKRDGSGDYIGLNNIFNDNETNSFRNKLLETIDEDYYFTLKWFLTDEYGFGLRNQVAHRYKSKDLYKRELSIFACLQIIRLLWGFQR